MMDIDNTMNDVRDAVIVALRGSDCKQCQDDRIQDVVAKVRVLISPVFEVIGKRDMENMQLQDYIREVEDRLIEQADVIKDFEQDEEERVQVQEAQAIQSIFDSILNQCNKDRKVV